MGGGKGKKGFAGLDAMVSDIEQPKASPPTPVEPSRQAERQAPSTELGPIYSRKPQSGGDSSGKWWTIGIGLFVLFALVVWAYRPDKQAPARSTSDAAPAPALTATPYPAPSAPRTFEPAPAPTYGSKDEQVPPVGNGLIFNRSEIRYCLSEKIRMSAWQGQVNPYSESSVGAFNAAVNDYNTRCAHFRYRSGMLESVRADVEANRNALELQGLARATANP